MTLFSLLVVLSLSPASDLTFSPHRHNRPTTCAQTREIQPSRSQGESQLKGAYADARQKPTRFFPTPRFSRPSKQSDILQHGIIFVRLTNHCATRTRIPVSLTPEPNFPVQAPPRKPQFSLESVMCSRQHILFEACDVTNNGHCLQSETQFRLN